MDRFETLLRLCDWQGRKYRRFDLCFPVRVRFPEGLDGAEIEGVSKNVSVGGLLVRAARPISPHTCVTFILTVHGEDAVRPIHLVGEGEIVRVEKIEEDRTFVIAVKCKTPVAQLEQFLPPKEEKNKITVSN